MRTAHCWLEVSSCLQSQTPPRDHNIALPKRERNLSERSDRIDVASPHPLAAPSPPAKPMSPPSNTVVSSPPQIYQQSFGVPLASMSPLIGPSGPPRPQRACSTASRRCLCRHLCPRRAFMRVPINHPPPPRSSTARSVIRRRRICTTAPRHISKQRSSMCPRRTDRCTCPNRATVGRTPSRNRSRSLPPSLCTWAHRCTVASKLLISSNNSTTSSSSILVSATSFLRVCRRFRVLTGASHRYVM